MKHFFITIFILIMSFSSVEAREEGANFALKNLEGKEITLSDYVGEQFVLLSFGTTWCPGCIAEVPILNELHKKYKRKGLKVMTVDVGESLETVRAFAEKKGIKYDVLLDTKSEVARLYNVTGIPDNFFFKKNGEMIRLGHYLTVDVVEDLMK